ncbi:MAG: EF-hand domain-containing protein [Sulfuricurvum sp.]
MTIGSNYSSYTTSMVSSNVQKSAPDFQAMAQDILNSLDTDGNGSIDATEFTSALQSGSSQDVTSTASSIFSQLDSDGSGTMSTDELMAALQASRPEGSQKGQGMGSMPPPPPPPPSDSSTSDSSSQTDVSQIFSALDTNQDGVISQDELAALFQSSGTTGSSNSSSSTASSTTTAQSNNTNTTDSEAFTKMRNQMLQQILSHYGANAASSDSTSTLSVSA